METCTEVTRTLFFFKFSVTTVTTERSWSFLSKEYFELRCYLNAVHTDEVRYSENVIMIFAPSENKEESLWAVVHQIRISRTDVFMGRSEGVEWRSGIFSASCSCEVTAFTETVAVDVNVSPWPNLIEKLFVLTSSGSTAEWCYYPSSVSVTVWWTVDVLTPAPPPLHPRQRPPSSSTVETKRAVLHNNVGSCLRTPPLDPAPPSTHTYSQGHVLHLCIHSCLHSFIHSFTPSLIHPFLTSSVCDRVIQCPLTFSRSSVSMVTVDSDKHNESSLLSSLFPWRQQSSMDPVL